MIKKKKKLAGKSTFHAIQISLAHLQSHYFPTEPGREKRRKSDFTRLSFVRARANCGKNRTLR